MRPMSSSNFEEMTAQICATEREQFIREKVRKERRRDKRKEKVVQGKKKDDKIGEKR